ncbi:MAG: LacI family transcriptional regulator [Clostridiaceae bacterium]|nr:LacI family transcriptional regulator [Clostridiaceae bacterium]
MAVIKDVANLAGVSVATVSKYLNQPENVREINRTKIAKAIQDLNYKPSSLARSMRTKRTNLIAIIVPEITNFYYSEVFNAVRVASAERGYTPILYTTEESVDILREYLNDITSLGADGIIFCFLDEDGIIDELKDVQNNIPVVLMSWDVNNTYFNSVVVDVYDGIFRATKYLIEQGHTHIAYVGGPADSRISKEKYKGYKNALIGASIEIYPEYNMSGKYRFQTGYRCAREFMCLETPPTAIVAANDVLAVGCVKYLASNGINVPEDCAVIGFDGINLALLYQPSITTMEQPIDKMGMEAVNLLVSKIDAPTTKNKQIIFKTTLSERTTTNSNASVKFEI